MRRPSVDPSFTFALSLVLSLLLCAPTFMHMLHGSVDVTEGAIRYLVALAISWCGVHGVASLVAGYASPDASGAFDMTYTPPTTDRTRPVHLWLVLRDDRGGLSYTDRSFSWR